jgi:RNA recognition motif-containing protein
MNNNSNPATSLFVGDLASFCDERHIHAIFQEQGFEVLDVKLMRGKQSMVSLNYGFVLMKSRSEALRAISMLDTQLFYGRKIRVSWAAPNMKIKKQEESSNSLYVKFQALKV